MASPVRLVSTAVVALAALAACKGSGGTSPSPSPSATPSPAPASPACPAAWLAPPAVTPALAAPTGDVVLHGAATGTQDYACKSAADGGAAWVFVGPEASLRDCDGSLLARHFASDGGAAAPEWQSPGGAYVVAHKVAAFTPDGGGASVPWLLLEAGDHGGTGPLGAARYVQRVGTDGGVAPAGPCNPGATQNVPYAADYYFYGRRD
jgi:hypothetical protein